MTSELLKYLTAQLGVFLNVKQQTVIVFPGPWPQFIFDSPGPQFVFTGPGPQFVFACSCFYS